MAQLTALREQLRSDFGDWQRLHLVDLLLARRSEAATVLIAIATLTVMILAWRLLRGRGLGRNTVAVPALLVSGRFNAIRHLPLLLMLAGLPCFMLALADPLLSVSEQQISYPGRRIAILLDASSSMMLPFATTQLGGPGDNDAAFLTTIAAAEVFVRQRKGGRYRDLVGLIEFGDEAYVITPFTTDYDNVLLAISLIGDWGEYMRFPDGGTAIGRAIDQGTQLFRAFDFLDAAGNAMVIFSDGEDTQVTSRGATLAEILSAAVAAKIPVYLVRTNQGKKLGESIPDNIWKPAVEKTGGRFFAASNEADVIRAISEIDQRSAGTISVKTYAVRQPTFEIFALAAGALWTAGLILKLAVPRFTTFP
ncbi:MAG: VWA domain-containing protein [Vicinamibacterales bacterium]